MRNYIILNGINSNTINGLLIQELPPITKPKIRTTIEEIDGRDGDITTKLGYSAYDKTVRIGLHGSFDINAIISYFNTEGTVVFSYESDKYYKYEIIDQIDFERLVRYRTADVLFHCQPFKYSTTEQKKEVTATEISESGSSITFNNTENAAHFSNFKMNGEIKQTTYTGKNKMPYSLTDIKAANTSGSWNNNVYTWNGVTFTVNDDLTITVGGTFSQRAYLYLQPNIVSIPKANYTVNGCPSGGSSTTYRIAFRSL